MLGLVSALTTALLGLTITQHVTAHNIPLKAHSRECFHENLHKDDQMTVTFQVGDRENGGSGNIDLDFWVRPETVSHLLLSMVHATLVMFVIV